MVAAARHHLKKFNHQNFDTLQVAFRHYDKASSLTEQGDCDAQRNLSRLVQLWGEGGSANYGSYAAPYMSVKVMFP